MMEGGPGERQAILRKRSGEPVGLIDGMDVRGPSVERAFVTSNGLRLRQAARRSPGERASAAMRTRPSVH